LLFVIRHKCFLLEANARMPSAVSPQGDMRFIHIEIELRPVWQWAGG
jgi:hypothetical protein